MRNLAFLGILSGLYAAKPVPKSGLGTPTIWDMRTVGDPQINLPDGGSAHSALWLKTFPWEQPQQFLEHSPIYYASFKTPASDLRTPIAESEELHFALKAQKASAVLVRVPDEYDGIRGRNSRYIEKIEQILAWMERYTQ